MLRIEDVHVRAGKREILKGFSLDLPPGETIGLTGQSGAGKTTLIRAVMGFLNQGCVLSAGRILLEGEEMTKLRTRKRRELCGRVIGYIPQSPMTAFDPRLRIGQQLMETLHVRLGLSQQESRRRAEEALGWVNLTDCRRVLEAIPAQLSGGMLQRIAMGLLLAMQPHYILADEPTSALDRDNRDLLLELLRKRCAEAGILFISHDVEALEALCRTVMVLADGRVVEEGPIKELLKQPVNPWTQAFAASAAKRGKEVWQWTEFESQV